MFHVNASHAPEPVPPSIGAAKLSSEEIRRLLTATGDLQQELFQAAREARRDAGVDTVKLRGVIEITNFCQKACDFCAIRANNKKLDRYRFKADEIMAIAERICEAGIGTVFLQGGQEPKIDKLVSELIPRLRRELGCEVLLNLGEKPKSVYEEWAALGATSYILKFETSSPELYHQIVRTPLDRRIECIRWIKETGMEVGTGNIVGLPGQTMETLISDVQLVMDLEPDFVSSSPFIPNEDTPMEHDAEGNVDVTLNTMAIYRILFPHSLVPTVSALEKLRPKGHLAGLNAGANVITINFTPKDARDKYGIYSKERFVVTADHALGIVEQAGLKVRPVGASA